MEERRKDFQDYVTKELCNEKEKTRNQQLFTQKIEIDDLKKIVYDFIFEMKSDRVHRIEVESKLFDGQSTINKILVETCANAESTQKELSAHKNDNVHLNTTTVSIALTIIGGISCAVAWAIEQIRKVL